MRAARALTLVLFAAGCGLDVVGTATIGEPDAAAPSVDAAAPSVDAAAPSVDDAAAVDGSVPDVDVPDASFDASDANGCASCPPGTAQMLCIAKSCQAVRRVFVTNGGFNGNLGGATGADAKCMAAAKTAKLNGTWLAWISEVNGDISPHRFSITSAPYRLLDGTQIAANTAKLLPMNTGTVLDHDIDVDENGASMDKAPQLEVWTGTNIYAFGESTCNDWMSSESSDEGTVGVVNNGGDDFTDIYDQTCDRNTQHLYCFEQ